MTYTKCLFRFDASAAVGLGHCARARIMAGYFDDVVVATLGESNGDPNTVISPRQSTICGKNGASIAKQIPETVTHIVADIFYSGNAKTAAREVADLVATGKHVTVIDSMPPDHFAPIDLSAPPPQLVVTPYLNARHLRPTAHAESWETGPEFAVLHEDFSRLRGANEMPDTPRVLLTCGGADPTGLTIPCLQQLTKTGLQVDVVLGPLFDVDLVRKVENMAAANKLVTTHFAPSSLADLMSSANIVVGRPGLTRYEAAALGRHGIYLSESLAYRAYFEGFVEAGLAEIFFSTEGGGKAAFFAKLAELGTNANITRYSKLNTTAMAKVDGHGAQNVVSRILQTSGFAR